MKKDMHIFNIKDADIMSTSFKGLVLFLLRNWILFFGGAILIWAFSFAILLSKPQKKMYMMTMFIPTENKGPMMKSPIDFLGLNNIENQNEIDMKIIIIIMKSRLFKSIIEKKSLLSINTKKENGKRLNEIDEEFRSYLNLDVDLDYFIDTNDMITIHYKHYDDNVARIVLNQFIKSINEINEILQLNSYKNIITVIDAPRLKSNNQRMESLVISFIFPFYYVCILLCGIYIRNNLIELNNDGH